MTTYLAMRKLLYTLFVFTLIQLTWLSIPQDSSGQNSSANHAAIDTTLFSDMEFRTVGPTRGGRVTAVEGHRAHPHKFYMGAAGGGGVWKTEDYGQSWINISDGHGFASTTIGAIEVADSDTSIIYVGTGTDGIRANVTTGRGMYKSTDAGKNWKFMGLEDAGQIGAVEVHPENPNRVYVAALGHPFGPNPQRGVFRSDDGGENWEKILFASDTTGAIDIELNTENPDEMYAALWRAERKPWTIISGAAKENGLYKSTDGGDTWKKLSNGLPQGLTGKADFAVTPADPDRVYALFEAPDEEEGLYRSDDRGESWSLVSDTSGLMNRPFYFTNITADTKNPDKVYVGNVRYWVSVDGGKTFERRRVTHADVHDLWVNPDNPNIQIQGNDGGATVTLDGGKTWSTQHNQPTAELYQVHVDDRFPYWLYAGQQDNTTIAVPSLPPAESDLATGALWHDIGGCETGPAVPTPNNPNITYANCKGRFGQYNWETGQEKQFWVGAEYMYGRNPADLTYRFQRVVPIEVSPHDSSVVYNTSQYVHRTENGGQTWKRISPDLTAFKPQYQMPSGGPITRDITGEEHYSTLYSIQESPHDPQVIWVGANDGPVHITRNGGEKWTEITPSDLPPNGRVEAIEPSPHTPGTAYIAVHRRFLDDFSPYIYKTEDYGNSWDRLTTGQNGIPADFPTRVVREVPDRVGLLYAGTDFGFFISFNDGANWQQVQYGLPNSPITDIKIHRKDLSLSTMGRGFWIMDNLSVLHQFDGQLAQNEYHLYKPRDAYRMRYRGSGGVPEYIDAGAMVDFFLKEIPEEPLVLQFINEEGEAVRSFVGKVDEDEENKSEGGDENEVNMMAPGSAPATAGDLKLKKGHNRFIWNLRYPGETVPSEDGETYFGVGAGPMTVPGSYTVKLSVGDRSTEQPLEILVDPRVQEAGVTQSDMIAQLKHNLKVRDAIGEAQRMAAEIDSARTRLKEAEGEDVASARMERLNKLHSELVTSEKGSYPPPMLIDQLEYMYYMTIRADQRPGNDAYSRYNTLKKELDRIAAEWENMKPLGTK